MKDAHNYFKKLLLEKSASPISFKAYEPIDQPIADQFTQIFSSISQHESYVVMSKELQDVFDALSDTEKDIWAEMMAESIYRTQVKIIQQLEEQAKIKE